MRERQAFVKQVSEQSQGEEKEMEVREVKLTNGGEKELSKE